MEAVLPKLRPALTQEYIYIKWQFPGYKMNKKNDDDKSERLECYEIADHWIFFRCEGPRAVIYACLNKIIMAQREIVGSWHPKTNQ